MDPDPDFPVLPVAEERLDVTTRRRRTGRVRVSLETMVDSAPVSAELRGERVEVTRLPIGRDITEAPPTRTEGLLTIVPVVEEVLVIERRLVLREEIHIRRIPEVETVETHVPIRRQTARIDRDETEREPQLDKENDHD